MAKQTECRLNEREDAITLGVECMGRALPAQFLTQIKTALALNYQLVLGYVEDEDRIYLTAIPEPDPEG